MKIESQVCSLESTKRLDELGVRQDSLFWYMEILSPERHWEILKWPHPSLNKKEDYPAYTVAELGEMLPDRVSSGFLIINKRKEFWDICYRELSGKFVTEKVFTDLSEAEARAKMLIYLIEKGLVRL